MGCDIHMYAETLDDAGNWVESSLTDFDQCHWVAEAFESDDVEEQESYKATNVVATDRNYWLFGLLNPGVRTEWPYSFEERGFPEDASASVKEQFEYEDGDAHSPSYLTKEELQLKAAELLISNEHGARDNGSYLHDLINKLHGEPDKQRIVFWFDN